VIYNFHVRLAWYLKIASGCSETAIIHDLGSCVPSSNLGTPTEFLKFVHLPIRSSTRIIPMQIDEHKKQFGNQAEEYTKYRKPYDMSLFDFLFSLIPSGKVKILDVACGTGKSTESLVTEDTQVFGCDHDPLMIEEAKKQAQTKDLAIQYSVGEVENLPYPDGEFDVVVVGTALHWFVNEKAISEIKRVLKPGGLLFAFWTLTTSDISEKDSIPSEFFKKYNWQKVPRELRDLDYISDFFKNNGLQKVSIHRLPSVNHYTVEEYVGLMKTASNFGTYSKEIQDQFVFELTELLAAKLGDRPYFSLEDELQMCYGFK
jgi:ubiquinone/menaquinone biosynthesis C-methylase UbiE